MRKLLAAVCLLLTISAAHAQTGSVKTQAALNTEIGTTGCALPTCLYPDSPSGAITAFGLRQGLLDLNATLFAGGGTAPVNGPATTTSGDFAAWDNATGTLLKDVAPGTGVGAAFILPVNGAGGLLTYGIIGTSGATVPLNNGGFTQSGPVNFTGTFELGGTTVTLPVSVANGGTGAATLATGKPLFGAGTAAITTGTLSGNTTVLATTTGSLTNGHCVAIDSSGNLVDAGGACTTGGGGGTVSTGGTGQLAYYATSGTTVAGLTLGAGLSITGTTLNVTNGGVTSVGGAAGAILLGTGLTISGNTINTLWTASGSSAYFNGGGDVAIGTSSFTKLLTLAPGINDGIGINETGGTIVGFIGPSGLGGFAVGTTSNDMLSLFTNGITRVRIDAGGNVGIGTPPTGALLTVNGTLAYGGTGGGEYYACTGTDTSALNTLIASGIKSLTLIGACGVTTLTTLPANFTLQGTNWLNDSISTSSATGNVVTMNAAGGDQIKNLTFTASTTRTGGDYIYATGGNVTVENILMYGFYNGLHITAVGSPGTACPSPFSSSPCFGLHASNLKFYGIAAGGSHDCILQDGTSNSNANPENDVYLENIGCSGVTPGAAITNGIEIVDAGELHITHSEFENISGANILVDPNGLCSNGIGVNLLTLDDAILDAGAAYGLHVIATNGACVQNIDVHDGWVANNANGIYVETDTGNGTYIIEIKIHDEHLINQTNDGIHLANNSNIGASYISNNYVDQSSSGAAFFVGNSVTGWNIASNGFIGGTYGGFFPSAFLSSTSAFGNFFAAATPIAGSPTLAINLTGSNVPNIP